MGTVGWRILRHGMLAAVCCSMLGSCYFNSAGRIVNSAAYQAKVTTQCAKPGEAVYQYGGRYYVELERFRTQPESRLQLTAFNGQDKDEPQGPVYKGRQMCEIPQDYALYLTGQKGTRRSGYLLPVENSAEIKAKGTPLPIVRAGDQQEHAFDYRSPNSHWLYTAAVFDWLLVDVPVTCVENASILGAIYLILRLDAEDDDDDDFDDDDEDCHHHCRHRR